MVKVKKKSTLKNGHEGEVLNKLKKYTIIDCEKCKFIHSIPVPTEIELTKLYKSEFFEVEKPNHLKNI